MIGIVLLISGVIAYFIISGSAGIESMISFNRYDANGNKITEQPLSVVAGVPGTSNIDLTVTVTNTGTESLSCEIKSLSPESFDNALIRDSLSVNPGKKIAWTSSLIPVAQFESETISTDFKAIISCSYNTGTEIITLPEKTGILSLFIKPEIGTGDFNVEINQGGIGSEFCGDNICQYDENAQNCPNDCAIANNVNFRTTDLSYVSGTAVGYSETCGSKLNAYGKTSGACTSYSCAEDDYLMLVPSSSGSLKFWIKDDENVCICDIGKTSGYPMRYSVSDLDAGKIDTTYTSFDSSKEISC